MRRLPALLTPLTLVLAMLLVAPLAVLGAHPGAAAAGPKKKATTVSLRLAPARVTVHANGVVEPTGLVAEVTPATAGRAVTFQRRDAGAWRTVARLRTDAAGQAATPVSVTAVGSWTYRARVAGTKTAKPALSGARSLTATSNTACSASPAPVDPRATGEAHCLLTRLDRWRADGLMGIGQQVNISRAKDWDAPVRGIAPAVVGFDLEELDRAATADYPYAAANIQGLLDRARAGAVLVASWHATNPFTEQSSSSPRHSLAPLLDFPGSAAYRAFWADWDAKLALLKRFQDGDSDGDGDDGTVDGERTAVVVRPLHEVNGGFFWWGKPTRGTYPRLYAALQQRAAAAGVHNIVWAYSGNRDTSTTNPPADYVPQRVDIGGLDTYDPETGRGNRPDVLGLEGYAGIARLDRVHRMALTEVGPHGSRDGSWNPKVITATVRKDHVTPLWAMLWFDDGVPSRADTSAGKKQIGSLTGGRAWLRSCFNSLCHPR